MRAVCWANWTLSKKQEPFTNSPGHIKQYSHRAPQVQQKLANYVSLGCLCSFKPELKLLLCPSLWQCSLSHRSENRANINRCQRAEFEPYQWQKVGISRCGFPLCVKPPPSSVTTHSTVLLLPLLLHRNWSYQHHPWLPKYKWLVTFLGVTWIHLSATLDR